MYLIMQHLFCKLPQFTASALETANLFTRRAADTSKAKADNAWAKVSKKDAEGGDRRTAS